MNGGLCIDGWLKLWTAYKQFNSGWPDGLPLAEQLALTVLMFQLIEEEAHKAWQTSSS